MITQSIQSIVIIGSGNVAESFARAIGQSSFELRQIFARNQERGAKVARIGGTEWTNIPSRLAHADLYLIAVSDRAVAEIAASLPLPKEAIVVHTAGCVPLSALPESFAHRAVVYPLQTFTEGRKISFSGLPFFIEASVPELQNKLEAFVLMLGGSPHRADSLLRARIHLAGVFACNFTNHFYACGAEMLRDAGLPYDVLHPLIRETTCKALDAADPATGQTGPAVRGDLQTQARHMALLGEDEALKAIYQSISKHIWETSKKI